MFKNIKNNLLIKVEKTIVLIETFVLFCFKERY